MSDRTGSVSGHPIGATLAGTLLFVIGLAIAAGTYENAWKERERRQHFLHAEGTVVAVLGTGASARPVVAFTSSSGDHLSFTDRRTGRFALGNRLSVLYPPENPIAAMVDDAGVRWLRTLLAAGIAFVLIGIGGYVAWYARRWHAAHAAES